MPKGLLETHSTDPIVKGPLEQDRQNSNNNSIHDEIGHSYKDDLKVIRRSAHLIAGTFKRTGI